MTHSTRSRSAAPHVVALGPSAALSADPSAATPPAAPWPPAPPPGAAPRGGPVRHGDPRRASRAVVLAGLLVAVVLVTLAALHGLRGAATGTAEGGAAAPTRDGAASADPGPATGLDPELERRFEEARAAAAEDGVELWITSGWRSAAEQQELVDQAVERYGSVEEARRWVLPPQTSEHVAGAAVDVGPTEGAYWLQQHGPRFGLCQTYANEVWHYEAATDPGGTCPAPHADASHGW